MSNPSSDLQVLHHIGGFYERRRRLSDATGMRPSLIERLIDLRAA